MMSVAVQRRTDAPLPLSAAAATNSLASPTWRGAARDGRLKGDGYVLGCFMRLSEPIPSVHEQVLRRPKPRTTEVLPKHRGHATSEIRARGPSWLATRRVLFPFVWPERDTGSVSRA